jgi:hypothetical protein
LGIEGAYSLPKLVEQLFSSKETSLEQLIKQLNVSTWNFDLERLSRKEIDLFDLRYITDDYTAGTTMEENDALLYRYLLQRAKFQEPRDSVRKELELAIAKTEQEPVPLDELKKFPLIHSYLESFSVNIKLKSIYHKIRRSDYILRSYAPRIERALTGIKKSIYTKKELLDKRDELPIELRSYMRELPALIWDFAVEHELKTPAVEACVKTIEVWAEFKEFNYDLMQERAV